MNNKHQDGIPDEEMPELEKEDFAMSKPNRFAKHVHAGSIMLIEPKRFGSGYKPEPARNEVVSHK